MNNEFIGTSTELAQLESQLAELDHEIYDGFESHLQIPKWDLKKLWITKILEIISEIRLSIDVFVRKERSRIETREPPPHHTQKKKWAQSVKKIPLTPREVLERAINTPAAQFLDWKIHDEIEEKVTFRGINLLRTRLRFLIEHPHGIQTSQRAIGVPEGSIHDPNIKADIRAHNARYYRPRFRS